jgi:hypothetical protein
VSADIPVSKINNPEVRNFLLKYTQTDPPNESTFRNNYLLRCYEETLNTIRVLCGKENIWVSTEKATNESGRKVANVVVGVLKNDQTLSEISFLPTCKEISAVNHITIARDYNEAMQTLWPDGVKLDNAFFLVTDAAPNIKKAAEGLSVSYPKLIQVTCVAHALHRVCETIRVLYPNVDNLCEIAS